LNSNLNGNAPQLTLVKCTYTHIASNFVHGSETKLRVVFVNVVCNLKCTLCTDAGPAVLSYAQSARARDFGKVMRESTKISSHVHRRALLVSLSFSCNAELNEEWERANRKSVRKWKKEYNGNKNNKKTSLLRKGTNSM
jgi:hypothetical protein